MFISNLLTVKQRQVHCDTRAIDTLANSQRGACPGEGVNHCVTFLGTGLDAPLNKTLIELGLVPFPPLFRVADNTRKIKNISLAKIKHIPRNTSTRIGSSVTHLLPFGLNPN